MQTEKGKTMADYIKREDAIEAFDPKQRRDWYTPWIVETLKDLPSADVAPVRHGRWEDEFKEDAEAFVKHRYVCTVCGNWQTYGKTAYCPNCGAKMDEGE